MAFLPPFQRFNTQPPEGGWHNIQANWIYLSGFNTQPPEGGWYVKCSRIFWPATFQHTAARRRLVVRSVPQYPSLCRFNTQPPEGGWVFTGLVRAVFAVVSTHSRPKAAGLFLASRRAMNAGFQHTAARRRLASITKAAWMPMGFNTQPPEGGWMGRLVDLEIISVFQHTAARRRLGRPSEIIDIAVLFQHTAARRRLGLIHSDLSPLRRFNTQPPEGGWSDGAGGVYEFEVSTHSRPKAAG